jgi:nucleoside-diphosphate-sugar epimerase
VAIATSSHGARFLLLGGGYTLERLALCLQPDEFVITSRSATTVERFRARGWHASCVDLVGEEGGLEKTFEEHPTIDVIIDSVPPTKEADSPTTGVERVVRAVYGSRVSRVVYLSTTGVFGVRDGSWVDEASIACPWNEASIARFACEKIYQGSPLTCSVLRLPAIVGPGRSTVESLRKGRYQLVGDGSNWTNRIHVEDLVMVLGTILKSTSHVSLLCVSDDEPVVACEMVRYFCNKYSLPWPKSVPEDVLRARGAYSMLSNQRVRNDLMKTLIKKPLRYPSYREHLSETTES